MIVECDIHGCVFLGDRRVQFPVKKVADPIERDLKVL